MNYQKQEHTNGINQHNGFATGGGEANVVLERRKPILFVNQNGCPKKCPNCRGWIGDEKNHCLNYDDDSRLDQYCRKEDISVILCSGCGYPEQVNGHPFGTHGDNYDCSFIHNE